MKGKKITAALGGAAAGLINGLLGSGGGMVVVPTLESSGLLPAQAHSGSVAVMLPLSAISVFMYLKNGHMELSQAMVYIPGGIIGAFIGSWLIRRMSPQLLRRLFGAVALAAGIRLLMR